MKARQASMPKFAVAGMLLLLSTTVLIDALFLLEEKTKSAGHPSLAIALLTAAAQTPTAFILHELSLSGIKINDPGFHKGMLIALFLNSAIGGILGATFSFRAQQLQ